jgi:hypothetical protein
MIKYMVFGSYQKKKSQGEKRTHRLVKKLKQRDAKNASCHKSTLQVTQILHALIPKQAFHLHGHCHF